MSCSDLRKTSSRDTVHPKERLLWIGQSKKLILLGARTFQNRTNILNAFSPFPS